LELGYIQLAKNVQDDPRAKAIASLMNFGMCSGKEKYASYVGAATAEKWFSAGVASVDDLAKRVQEDPDFLTPCQRIMWNHRFDFAERIPRKEVELVADVVRNACPPGVVVELAGSYCRGAADCGDADVLVFSPEGEMEWAYRRLIDGLYDRGFLTSTLKHSPSSAQWQGGCCLACLTSKPELAKYGRHRRLDIKVYPWSLQAFARLYFGSGERFNRAVRLHATRLGYTLSDHGIRRVIRGKSSSSEQAKWGKMWEGPLEEDPSGSRWQTEESIFNFLRLPFFPPEARGDDVDAGQLGALAAVWNDAATEGDAHVTIAKGIVVDLELLPQPATRSISVATSSWRHRGVIGLDCEFVGVGKNTGGIGGDRNALARVSLVDYSGSLLLDTFVRVEEPIVDFRVHITGILQEHVDAGIPFQEAQRLVRDFIAKRVVVGHSLTHDFKTLCLPPPPATLLRDTYSCQILRTSGGKRSLKVLMEQHLGQAIQDGIHCSVEDARAAMALYRSVEDSWDATANPVDSELLPPEPAAEHLCSAAVVLRRQAPQQGVEASANVSFAEHFERLAKGAGGSHAKAHYLRVARTLRALPFSVSTCSDLSRPELRCVGQGKARTVLAKLLSSSHTIPANSASSQNTDCSMAVTSSDSEADKPYADAGGPQEATVSSACASETVIIDLD